MSDGRRTRRRPDPYAVAGELDRHEFVGLVVLVTVALIAVAVFLARAAQRDGLILEPGPSSNGDDGPHEP